MKKRTNLRKCSVRFLACLLAVVLLFGLLPTVAMAASASPGDSYIAITRAGDTAKHYGVGEGDAVINLEPGTYHVENVWTFAGDDEVKTAENVCLSMICDYACSANSFGGISITALSDNAGTATNYLCYGALDAIQISIVQDSLKLYSDGSEYGPDVDADNKPLNEFYNYAGNLADGQSCRLEFDVEVTSALNSANPETSNAPEASEPVNSEAPDELDPRLPDTFDGVVVTSYRGMYTSDNRPDGIILNAISDDPNWGNELYFLHLIDLETGEEFRQGVVRLTAGRMYRVEVVAHNAARTFNYRTANDAKVAIEMPRSLSGGSLGIFGATVSASNAVPVAVSATLGLYCEESVKLEFMNDSATFQSKIGRAGEQLDYRMLFTDGALLGQNGTLSGGEDGGSVTFVIRAIADDTIPLATGEDRLENPVFATPYTQLDAAPEASEAPQPTESAQPSDGENANGNQTADGNTEDTPKSNWLLGVLTMVVALFIDALIVSEKLRTKVWDLVLSIWTRIFYNNDSE